MSSVTKNITIKVSEDFDHQWFLHNTTPIEKTDIISIGSSIYKELRSKISERLTPEKQLQIAQIVQSETEEYQNLITKLTGTNTLLHERISHIEPQLGQLKKMLLQKDDSVYDEIQQYRAKIKQEYESTIKKLKSDHTQLQKEYMNMIDKQRDREDNIRTEYEKKIEHERNKYNIYNNSSKKGRSGEAHAHQTLVRLLPTAVVTDTSADATKGDFHIQYKSVNILYENKNYDSRNVPKREIDKFLRDVTFSTDCDCGIMASQKTGIVARDNFSISYTENGKPIVYLHKTLENKANIKLAVELLVSVIQNGIVFDESKLAKLKATLKLVNDLKKNNERHQKNIEPFLITYRQNKELIQRLEHSIQTILTTDVTTNPSLSISPSPTVLKNDISRSTEIDSSPSSTKNTKLLLSISPSPTVLETDISGNTNSISPLSPKSNYITWMSAHREEIKNDLAKHPDRIDKNMNIAIAKEALRRWNQMQKN